MLFRSGNFFFLGWEVIVGGGGISGQSNASLLQAIHFNRAAVFASGTDCFAGSVTQLPRDTGKAYRVPVNAKSGFHRTAGRFFHEVQDIHVKGACSRTKRDFPLQTVFKVFKVFVHHIDYLSVTMLLGRSAAQGAGARTNQSKIEMKSAPREQIGTSPE